MMRWSFIVAMTSLALLQLHLILSIAWHAAWHGGVATRSFWQGKTGWWVGTGRIQLDEERVCDVSEKV